ncbi:hypothetical protein AB0J86_31335 [Micromonospora sp. NPDC049559]|uniref:hypothetical protein n=1 Tax=Micromonospora sp. NPDC049559 TaxID=3155923 RepID=UPI00343EEEA7
MTRMSVAVIAVWCAIAVAPAARAGTAEAAAGGGATGVTHRTVKLVAGPSPEKKAALRAAGVADDPPPFTCYFNIWEASWPGGNPAPITFSSSLECGDAPPGPWQIFTLKTELRNVATGFVEAEGPALDGILEGRVTSGATSVPLQRPAAHYVRQVSSILNLPDESGAYDIWYYLPAECTGVGGPLAECDFRNAPFTV